MSIFQPAIALMYQLKYPQKFTLITIVLLLPLVLVLYFWLGEVNHRIEFSQREIYGNAYLRPLISLSQNVYLSLAKDTLLQQEIEHDLQQIEAVDKKYNKILETAELWAELKGSWQRAKTNSVAWDGFAQLIEQINKLRARVGDKSNLILDPDLDTYYLMDANLIKLPALRLTVSQLHSLLKSPEVDVMYINSLAKVVEENRRELLFNLDTGFNNNPKGNLRPVLSGATAQLDQQLQTIYRELSGITTNTSPEKLQSIRDLLLDNLNYSWSLWQKITDELDILLGDRIQSYRQRLIIIATIISGFVLLAVYLFVGFYQAVMTTVYQLELAAQRMTQGDYTEVNLHSKDELAQVVTSFNRIAKALVLAEAKFRSIFENSIDGIFQTSPEGKYLSANPALARMYGYSSPEELIASLTDLNTQLYVESDRREQFRELIEKEGKVTGFESQIYRRDGVIIWISENARAVRDETGKILYYEGTVEDITQRKIAEVELELANQEISALNAKLAQENTRMKNELEVVRKLQQMILPRETELKQIRDLEVAGFMQPADEVGGDYYDVLQQSGRVKIGIGDVTGHGLESGMVMLMAQMAVRTLLVSQESDITKFLDAINQAIYGNVQRMNADRFMTLTLLDYENGKITLSGQHEQIIIARADGKIECVDTDNLGFPIGLEETIRDFLDKLVLDLHTDDVVVLYTDGITEAENAYKEMYGLDRLCQVIKDNRHLPAQEICQAIVTDVREFIGSYKIYDDITLVVLKQK